MMSLIVNSLPSVSFGILLEYLKPYQNPSSNDKTWHNQSMKLFVQDVTLKADTESPKKIQRNSKLLSYQDLEP